MSSASVSRAAATERLQNFKWLGNLARRPRALQASATHLYALHQAPSVLMRAKIDDLASGFTNVDVETQPAGKMTKEEELRRERQRFHLSGIASFNVFTRGASDAVFLTCNGQLYLVSLAADGTAAPTRSLWEEAAAAAPTLNLEGAKMDVTHAPGRPFRVSFVLRNNLYVCEFNEDAPGCVQAPTPVTTVGATGRTCAVADYIIEEEFSRYNAHWWSPGASQVMFTVTDVTMLATISLIDKDNQIETMPFPKVGDPNARSSIVVADLNADSKAPAYRILRWSAVKKAFPFAEYLTRLAWRGDDTVYGLVLSRSQEECVHFAIPVAKLPVCEQGDFFTASAADDEAVAGALAIVLRKSLPWAWVETTSDLDVAAERTVVGLHGEDEAEGGYFHLHAVSADGKSMSQLTSGRWNVAFHSLKVADGVAYFKASPTDPFVTSVCAVPLGGDAAGAPPLKVFGDASHHVSDFCVLPDGKGVAYVASSVDTTPFLAVASSGATELLSVVSRPTLHPSFADGSSNAAPTIATTKNAAGHELAFALFLPNAATVTKEAAAAKAIPLMLYVYGGPHVQLISKAYDVRCNPVLQALVSFGVAVAIVDNQMSKALGLRAHAVCKRAMGSFETADYAKVVGHLVGNKWRRAEDGAELSLDRARVGVYGWSYGGYATLLALSQAPDVFKLGFAGAPVGDWRLYDTGYTERYMGLLPTDEATYVQSSIPAMAAGFPDEPNRVFIAHGLTDENVHFAHTSRVLEALVQHNKPYCLQLYPGERHGLRQNPKSREHYDVGLIAQAVTYL